MEKSYDEHKQHTFDSYCKRILKNEMRDYYNELNKRRKFEIPFSELTPDEIEKLSVADEYFTDGEHFYMSDNGDMIDIVIKDELIANALKSISANKRDVILLSYFLDMNDGEIAKKLNMVRSTIQYKRTSILKELKKIMEEKGNE